LPAAGIRGANAATVFYAVMFFICVFAPFVIRTFVISPLSGNLTSAEQFIPYLNYLSNLYSVFAIDALIFLAVTVWYWIGMFRLIKTSLSLPLTFADW
jgi:hypothetical protein